MATESPHDGSPSQPSLSAATFPTHEIEASRIRFDDNGEDWPHGGFALVRRALLFPLMSTSSPQLVAVKILRVDERLNPDRLWKVSIPLCIDNSPPNAYRLQRLTREVLALASIDHPNILRLIGSHFDRCTKAAWIISPWAAHGDVPSFLEKEKQNKSMELDLLRRLNLVSRFDSSQSVHIPSLTQLASLWMQPRVWHTFIVGTPPSVMPTSKP